MSSSDAAAVVLADQIRGDALLLGRLRRPGTRRARGKTCRSPHGGDCILARWAGSGRKGGSPSASSRASTTPGVDERIEIWIERKEGGVWAVGRAVNPQHRPSDEPRPRRLRIRGLRASGRAGRRERGARGRRQRLGRRRPGGNASSRSSRSELLGPSSGGSSGGDSPRPLASGLHADPSRPQPRPRRCLHVLGASEKRVDTRGFEFEHVLRDIQTLNEWALEGRLEVTAISLHAYPFVQERTPCCHTGRVWARVTGPWSSRRRR